MRPIAVLSVLLSAASATFAAQEQPAVPPERLVPANNRSDQGLVEVRHPRGGYSKNLQGRFQEYFVVTRGADGSLLTACVHDPDQAERLAKGAESASSAQTSER